MAQQTAVTQVMSDIKQYVRSLDVSNNPVYQENQILILSCFKKAMEICEGRLAMEKEQISKAWDDGDYAYFYSKETGRDFENGEEYYNETYNQNK